MTWGEIQLDLKQALPDLPLERIRRAINSSYREILDHMPWKGLEAEGVLQTTATYETGTLSVNAGATTVTGSGTTWTSAMTGRKIRIAARDEFYEFTYVSATSGTLDRAFEGDSNLSAQTYQIFRNVYTLPSDFKAFLSLRNPRLAAEITRLDLNAAVPTRPASGDPAHYDMREDTDEASPPVLHQVELYPIPEDSYGLPFTYEKAVTPFDGTNTSAAPLPFVSPDAVISGASWRLTKSADDRADFEKFLSAMVVVEMRRVGSSRLEMDRRFTRHNARRWQE